MRAVIWGVIVAWCVAGVAGCSSTGIAVREAFGQAKREQLVNRVEEARDDQEQAKEQFATTLERFRALTGGDGGDLEKLYSRLSRDLERSEARAADVSERIDQVETVAGALFSEWEKELDSYQSPDLRRASAEQLDRTQRRYGDLLDAMRRAESKMGPVLVAFNDQVLFLKHNLNARAIASLETTAASLEGEIAGLIAEMEASIAEANAFIDAMGT